MRREQILSLQTTVTSACIHTFFPGCVPSFSQLHPYSLRQKLSHALIPEKFARGELLIRQVRPVTWQLGSWPVIEGFAAVMHSTYCTADYGCLNPLVMSAH
jgi:hypothetical protein